MATQQLTGPGLENFPTELELMIQSQTLVREVNDALYPNLVHRMAYDHFYPPSALGQRWFFTQNSLLADVDDPITPVADTDMDNGMSPVNGSSVEQYHLTLNKYGNTLDTNLLTSSLSITNQFIKNAHDLGLNAGKSVEKASRRHLYAAYGGGDTYLTANASNTNTINVANVFGFDWEQLNGTPTAVSGSNPLLITANGTSVNVTGVANVSIDKAIDWAPGQLTLDANVTGVIGDRVLAGTSPNMVDPNGLNQNIYDLTTSDSPTLDMVLDQVSLLMEDNVPTCDDMYYHVILSPIDWTKLQKTTAFREIFRGQGNEDIFTRLAFGAFGNVKFFVSPLVPKGTRTLNGGSTVIRHMITHGGEIAYEGRYADVNKLYQLAGMTPALIVSEFDDESWIMTQHRTPQDRHGEVISSSWKFLGGFAVKTDRLTLSSRNYGRAVVGRTGASA